MANELYKQVVAIARDYLGPAADRFVERQIGFHLNKKPDDLSREDIPKLTEWIKVTLAMLTQDVNNVNDCAKRIAQLG